MSEFLETFIEEEIENRIEEALNNKSKEFAIKLLKSTKLSESEIAANSGLLLEEVEELSKEIRKYAL